jgi:thiol:disulfide interchange protein DsbC
MRRFLLVCCLALAAGVVSPGATAAATAATDELAAARAAVQRRFPTVRVGEVRTAPLPGIFEFNVGIDVYYTSADARFLLRGDLMDFGADRNLTEERRADLRKTRLAAVPEAEMIVFGPAKAPHTVTVFTDVDCGYCRRLHQGMAELNERGVRVRYLFFPRAGFGSESWQKAQDVWCAKDRKAALTDAKSGRPVPSVACANPPIARQYELGQELGLDGTPMIVSQDGFVIGGYLPPPDLVQRLEQLAISRPGK